MVNVTGDCFQASTFLFRLRDEMAGASTSGSMAVVLSMLVGLVCVVQVAVACPDQCQCVTEGRGQRVMCSKGQLSTIMSSLPHNTARLILQDLTAVDSLKEADLTRAPRSIIQLTISNSGMEEVQASTFLKAMASLQVLDLSRNSIRSLAAGAFEGLSSLRSLNLSSNRLDDVGSALDPLVSLQQLDLSHNYISQLQPSTLHTLSSLNFLSLNGNNFRSLNGAAFQSVPFLTELRIRECGVVSVNSDFFTSLPRVLLLDLGNNRLSTFPSSTDLSRLHQLKHLYLDNNELMELRPHQFANLSLLTLSLAHNRISAIPPQALSGLIVEDLDLSENKLLELRGESLKPVAQHLAMLSIANNPVRVLQPDAFEGLRLLETLNISACSLTALSADTFSSLYNLRKLDASWNHVQNISESLVKVLNRLVMVNFHHNAWLCDCHIKPFRNWLRSRSSAHKLYCLPSQQVEDCSALKCSSPPALADRLISNLLDSDLEKCRGGGAASGLPVPIQISIVLACLLVSLGMLLLTLYLWRRGSTKKELKNLFKKRRKTEHPRDKDLKEEDADKIAPFIDCDNESLKESHRSFVFRNYFDHMVTDPKLLEPMTPLALGPSEPQPFPQQRDSVYSSDPAMYEASHNGRSIVVGIESTV